MTLTRFDKKCGGSGIPDNAKCHKGGSHPSTATIAAALTAGGIAAFALSRKGSSQKTKQTASPESGPPQLPGLTPIGLLPPARRPKSKTQRMRENTQAAVRGAEQAMGRAAQAEITRAGAVANAMASAGEATGMAAKTTLRELRLRTEAARRRFEPGYRRSPAATPKRPAQLSPGMDPAFEVPLNPPRRRSPEAAPVDPRTGQPRRRRARGFGRPTGDNYIPFYAPVTLQKNR